MGIERKPLLRPDVYVVERDTAAFEAARTAVDIVCAGDSLTGWNNFGPAGQWPYRTYPGFLNELCDPPGLRVANGGIAGEISDNGPLHRKHRGCAKMFVRWSPKYSVKDETLDAQHKQLFEIMNSLYSDMRTCHPSRSELRDVIESLVQYGDAHFRAEEAAIPPCGYPDLTGHTAEHRRYRHELQRLTYALTSDEKNSLDKLGDFPHDLMNFLKAWWTKHIVHMGRDYMPFLRHRK